MGERRMMTMRVIYASVVLEVTNSVGRAAIAVAISYRYRYKVAALK